MDDTKRSILGKTLKSAPLSKAQEEEKIPTPSSYGTTDWPPQNRTSPAGKQSDGRSIANDQCLFGRDGVALKEIHGTMSPKCSFCFFKWSPCSVQRTSIIKRIECNWKKRLFKERLFILDVGLLGCMGDLDAKTIIQGNAIFEEFKGALTEQYVHQQLKTVADIPIFYWSAKRANAEVDFVIQYSGKVVPIEVKAAENLQAKSLKSFKNRYKHLLAIRTSMSNYRKEDELINMPLYTINSIRSIIEEAHQIRESNT